MLGSMLISGRRTGQCRLDLGDGTIKATPTNANFTLNDVLFDVQQKLDEIKANPSPVEIEIKFLEDFLRRAKGE